MQITYGILAFRNPWALSETIASAKRLKHNAIRDWVIVDNSADVNICKTNEELIKAHLSNEKFIYIKDKENLGENLGTNLILDYIKSEWCLFLQDDFVCRVQYDFIDFAIQCLSDFKDKIGLVQLKQRPWSNTNKNIMCGKMLRFKDNLYFFEILNNSFGGWTNQVKIIRTEIFRAVWPKEKLFVHEGQREGSVVEFEAGRNMQKLGLHAGRINTGQFEHILQENSRFINGGI